MKHTPYRLRVLEAYEDEVAGAAYFDALSHRYPQRAGFFGRCAALERATALRLLELLRKYQLTPALPAVLVERGALDARQETATDARTLLRDAVVAYAGYVVDFEALEAMGPAEDQPILAALTAHEVTLIEWMRAEAG